MIRNIFITIILSFVFVFGIYAKPDLPEIKFERVKIEHQDQGVIVYCIDGYKWISVGYDIEQAYKIDHNGNIVPVRCE